MLLISIFIFALLGLCVGRFLNVCIDRLPRRQSIIAFPAHCPDCNNKLGILDLIPVLGYLMSKGRCRYCQAHKPLRPFLVEGITALLFALLFWKFGLGLELGMLLVYVSLFIVIFVIDLERQLVLNKVVYAGMVIAFILSFFWPGLGMKSSLAGGATGLVFMAIVAVISRGGTGWGDVKLAALVGLATGFPLVLIALALSCIGVGLAALALLALKIKKRKDSIPFAPFLVGAALVTLIWGDVIYNLYLP